MGFVLIGIFTWYSILISVKLRIRYVYGAIGVSWAILDRIYFQLPFCHNTTLLKLTQLLLALSNILAPNSRIDRGKRIHSQGETPTKS